MLDFTGVKCPVCAEPFTDHDDIVVCPTCGAPYHRTCYHDKGECVFPELHEAGKSWQAPAPPVKEIPVSAEIKDKECPLCGLLNATSATACTRCGANLNGNVQTAEAQARTAFGGTVPFFAFDPMGGVSPTEEVEPQVSFGDLSKLVKQNTMYYLPVFKGIHVAKRSRFNFSAFLFSGPWMLYRKQYKLGAIITALMFLLYFGSVMAYIFLSGPVYADLLKQIGINGSGVYPTSDQMLQIYSLLIKDSNLYFRFVSPLFFYAAMLIVMVFCGARGNKLYFQHCVNVIKEIRGQGNASDASVSIENRGGVNLPIAICMLVCYLLLANLPSMLL